MQQNILVSIVIPVYNGANYIADAINSALNQSYKNIEIIVVNDGSSDEHKTREVCQKFSDKIIYLEKENGGVSSALNYGIQKAKGNYINWLSHDDILSKNKIKNQVEILNKHKGNIIPYCKFIAVNKNGKVGLNCFFNKNRKSNFTDLKSLFPFNVCFATGLYPKHFLIEHPFNVNAKYTQDLVQFFTCLKDGYTFIYSRHCTYYYRKHEMQGTFTKTGPINDEIIIFHKTILKEVPSNNENIGFYKKYYYYACEKSARYLVYNEIICDIKKILIDLNHFKFSTKIKGKIINKTSRFLYKLRNILTHR